MKALPFRYFVSYTGTAADGSPVSGWSDLSVPEPISSGEVVKSLESYLCDANHLARVSIVSFQRFDQRPAVGKELL